MSNELRRTFMPYCLDRQPDGRYVVLNRDYKPIGFNTMERIEYSEYPILVNLPDLTGEIIAKLSCHGGTDPQRIYLYDDASVPTASAAAMQSYLARLAILAALKYT